MLTFNTLSIVCLMEKTLIIDCITHYTQFVANDASFGMFALSDIFLYVLPISSANLILFHQPSVEAISCVQKSKKHFDLIETDSNECGTIICLQTHSEKIKKIAQG